MVFIRVYCLDANIRGPRNHRFSWIKSMLELDSSRPRWFRVIWTVIVLPSPRSGGLRVLWHLTPSARWISVENRRRRKRRHCTRPRPYNSISPCGVLFVRVPVSGPDSERPELRTSIQTSSDEDLKLISVDFRRKELILSLVNDLHWWVSTCFPSDRRNGPRETGPWVRLMLIKNYFD